MRDLEFGMVRLISLKRNITWYGLMQSDENVSVLCDVRYGTEHRGHPRPSGMDLKTVNSAHSGAVREGGCVTVVEAYAEEVSMRINPIVLAITLVSGSVSLSNDLTARATLSPTAGAVAESAPDSASSIEGLSIARQTWVREGGLLVAEITFFNKNEFSVLDAIVACDFFDPPDLFIGRRGSLITRVLPPGRTTISGIEFTMLKHNVFDPNMVGGACRLSADASAIW